MQNLAPSRATKKSRAGIPLMRQAQKVFEMLQDQAAAALGRSTSSPVCRRDVED